MNRSYGNIRISSNVFECSGREIAIVEMFARKDKGNWKPTSAHNWSMTMNRRTGARPGGDTRVSDSDIILTIYGGGPTACISKMKSITK